MTTSPEYLVQYGRSAFVGRFTASDVAPPRGERVVVRTARGDEVGVVLCAAAENLTQHIDPHAGTLLRLVGSADEACLAVAEAMGHAILTEAEALVGELPLTLLDAEVMLDRGAAVIHVLPWGPCDADPLFEVLSARFGFPVRALDVSRAVVATDPPSGCGKPDCGSGGCSTGGCSTGSCSRGAVKSADELTAHFAELRQKMEEQAARRTAIL